MSRSFLELVEALRAWNRDGYNTPNPFSVRGGLGDTVYGMYYVYDGKREETLRGKLGDSFSVARTNARSLDG